MPFRRLLTGIVCCLPMVLFAQPALVPWPTANELKEGTFPLKQVSVIEGEGAQGWGRMLRSDLVANDALARNQDEILHSVRFQRDTAQGEEGYAITVEKDKVTIDAATRQGALNATQTLRQLAAKDSTGTWYWPMVHIQDAPAFAWRGTMLDVCRHFYSVDFLKRYLDVLASLKLNIFHWHLTDDQSWRVEVKKYPRLTSVGAWRTEADGSRYGGFYTQDQIKEVVAYAAARGITVVPEIEFPGHCSAAIAAYPWLGCRQDTIPVPITWGVFNDVYCVGRDSTWTFFRDVLDELVPLFPAPWFHIGGDEVPKVRWQACPDCQARMRKEDLKDEHALQAWTVKRLQDYLATKGKRLIGWDEVLEGGLDSTAIVEVWRGDEQGRKARANGNAMIRTIYFDASPANLPLDKVIAFDPLLDGDARGILGAECPVWSEGIDARSIGWYVFPRMQVYAERMWSGKVGEDIRKRTAPQIARLEQQGWIIATADKDLFRSEVSFDPGPRNWLVTAQCGRKDMDATWRMDQRSGSFTDSLRVEAPGTLLLTPRWKGEAVRDPIAITIADNLALGAKETIEPTPSPKYGHDPEHGLTDGLLGTNSYSDGLWYGWWGPDLTITIDMDSVRTLHGISIRCLQQVGAWIVLPKSVSFETSRDGKAWTTLTTATHQVPIEEAGPLVHDFIAPARTPIKARYVRAVLHNSGKLPAWHLGADGNSWVFADEVVVR
ncbi:MAG: family 20 glycosylhydrolase [Flavobacteriales bacterium]|nr:family 20 glycosylhydrolase [Flavobacteriales bacterium]